ncbi:Protein kinase domain-containing protein [Balamuthia mandrillaris]
MHSRGTKVFIPPGATELKLPGRFLGPADGKALAEALRQNTTLVYLDLSGRYTCVFVIEGGSGGRR